MKVGHIVSFKGRFKTNSPTVEASYTLEKDQYAMMMFLGSCKGENHEAFNGEKVLNRLGWAFMNKWKTLANMVETGEINQDSRWNLFYVAMNPERTDCPNYFNLQKGEVRVVKMYEVINNYVAFLDRGHYIKFKGDEMKGIMVIPIVMPEPPKLPKAKD